MVFSTGVVIAGAVLLTVWGWAALVATNWVDLPTIVWITILYTAVFASAATFVSVSALGRKRPDLACRTWHAAARVHVSECFSAGAGDSEAPPAGNAADRHG